MDIAAAVTLRWYSVVSAGSDNLEPLEFSAAHDEEAHVRMNVLKEAPRRRDELLTV